MLFFHGVFASPVRFVGVVSLLLALAPLQAAQKDADKPPPFSDRSLLKIVGVDVVDKYTVKFNMTGPDPTAARIADFCGRRCNATPADPAPSRAAARFGSPLKPLSLSARDQILALPD